MQLGDIKFDSLRQYKYISDLVRQIRVAEEKFKADKKKKQAKKEAKKETNKEEAKKEEPAFRKITLVVARDYYDW